MVDTTGDIPERDDVKPAGVSMKYALDDILESGEVKVYLENDQEYELHAYDTYVFGSISDRPAMVYTQKNDDDHWFRVDKIVSIERHYD